MTSDKFDHIDWPLIRQLHKEIVAAIARKDEQGRSCYADDHVLTALYMVLEDVNACLVRFRHYNAGQLAKVELQARALLAEVHQPMSDNWFGPGAEA